MADTEGRVDGSEGDMTWVIPSLDTDSYTAVYESLLLVFPSLNITGWHCDALSSPDMLSHNYREIMAGDG